MRNLILILVLLLGVYAFSAEKTYGNCLVYNVVRVYDGDTFFGDIAGFPGIIGEGIGIRLNGLDTPELSLKTYMKLAKTASDSVKAQKIYDTGLKAKAHLEKRLKEAKTVVLKDISRGKYFRIVATVYADSINVNEELIKMGLAKPYDGGTKTEWF